MNNFKFYVQELRKMFSMYNDYSVDEIISSTSDLHHSEYLVPIKVSEVKKKRERKRPLVVRVGRSSPAYDYFITEYRGDKLSEDGYGNVLVPENDYYESHKTR